MVCEMPGTMSAAFKPLVNGSYYYIVEDLMLPLLNTDIVINLKPSLLSKPRGCYF